MKKTKFLLFLMGLAIGSSVFAGEVKEDFKKTGRDIKQTAKDVGHKFRDAAREVGHGFKNGWHKMTDGKGGTTEKTSASGGTSDQAAKTDKSDKSGK